MQSPIVTVTGGQIKGCQKTNLNGETFYSFLGIPFGKPPTGELRFKAPEPVEPWTGIKDATKDGDVCYQRNEFFQHLEGSEDCLHLNVFTKTVPKESCCLRPVMVWIYGGAFTRGSNKSVLYGPEFLMTENIVLVCINYRVGFLGFLHLEDASLDVPGNAGLKDQQLALKWVQKNIANFNGDPNNVTIFGESAGSASVHYHVLSPTSAGLFHKAIMQSGCLLNPWPTSDYYALRFAKSINENINTEEEALNLFKSMSVADFYAAQEKFYESVGGTKVIAPNIEKPNPTAVISSPPAELLLKGQYNKVPILMGYCNKEGLLLEFYKKIQLAAGKTPDERLSKMSFEKLIPSNVNKEDPKVKLLLKKIMDTYIEGPNVTDKFALSTDYLFLAGILATAKLHAKTSSNPVYLYRVSLDAGLNLLKKISKLTEPGVCHADELGYLFNVPIAAEFLNKGETEEIAIKRFVKLWTNFAKTGNPTPEKNELNISWRPLDAKEMNFLDIGTELTLQTDPEPERMAIWKEIFQLHPVTANFL